MNPERHPIHAQRGSSLRIKSLRLTDDDQFMSIIINIRKLTANILEPLDAILLHQRTQLEDTSDGDTETDFEERPEEDVGGVEEWVFVAAEFGEGSDADEICDACSVVLLEWVSWRVKEDLQYTDEDHAVDTHLDPWTWLVMLQHDERHSQVQDIKRDRNSAKRVSDFDDLLEISTRSLCGRVESFPGVVDGTAL